MKWRSKLGVLYDCSFEGWAIKKQHVQKLSMVEIRMLRWISLNIRKETIRNEEIL